MKKKRKRVLTGTGKGLHCTQDIFSNNSGMPGPETRILTLTHQELRTQLRGH